MLRSPLLHFLLAGFALFVIEAAGSWAPEPVVVRIARSEIEERLAAFRLQMGRAATPQEARAIERQVEDDALWLEQAFSLGLLEVDPVVRQRLVLNMRFLEGEGDASESELVARAIELGMDRSDPVVQRRLIDRVQAIVRAGVRAEPPAREVLEAYYRETAERWREPALLDLSHVYLSRDKRGEAARRDAEELLARFSPAPPDVEAAIREGDPFLAGHRLRGASPTRIVARLGPSFAAGVDEAPVRRWIGPIESAFGQHLVWIHDRTESRIPALDEIERRVVEDWFERESRAALREFLDRRREVVEIRVIDEGSSAGDAAAA